MNVFKEITEIYILVPALLGLKGNLEMTLASRLSTQVTMKLEENCLFLFDYLGKYWKYG
jgi:cation transporter-like permease